MNVTLDGYTSGPNCELDWHFKKWTSEMADTLYAELRATDTIILGRITYSAMAKYWPGRANDISFPREDLAFADLMNNHTKLVFSNTLRKTEWSNSVLAAGDAVTEISKLKRDRGKNMIIYGSGKMVQSLILHQLIDEYQLWIHPIVLGTGKRLFPGMDQQTEMKLMHTQTFSSGVILVTYCQ